MRFLEEPRTSVEAEMPLAHATIKAQSISQAFRLRDPAAAGLQHLFSQSLLILLVSLFPPFLN